MEQLKTYIWFGQIYNLYWNPIEKEMVVFHEWREMDGDDTQPCAEYVCSITSLKQFNNSVFA